MIIDSHAHYNNNAYKKPFRYLAYAKDGYSLKEGEREQLFQELVDANILYSIEPGVSLQSCEEVLQLCAEYPNRIFPAMGIHPTRSIYEKWSDRKKLDTYAKTSGVIAIGECGLDYHYKREEQHRLKQHIWFLYQLDLAWRLKKPVILHVRDAHEDALRILKWHPARKLGGVIHCFYGSWEIAEQYLKLGYHFGIGGSLLQLKDRANALYEAVEHIPLDTYVSQMQALGVDLATIQSLVGHADVDMTKHYLHVQDPIRIAAITKFDRAFAEEPETHSNIIDFMKSS